MRWCGLALVLILMAGCIPSEPPATASDTAPTTSEGIPDNVPATGLSASTVGTPQATDVGVQVLPRDDGPGYRFRGSYGLAGIITKAAGESEWKLSGEFHFPTGGFTVGELFISPLQDMSISSKGVALQQKPVEYMVVSIPVRRPAPGSETPGEQTVAVSAAIPGGEDMQFTLVLVMD